MATRARPIPSRTRPTRPAIYGATKLAGEAAVRAAAPDAAILRTAWVYAEGGRNFMRTMLNAARKNAQHLRVVSDQRGNPTNADDLAQAVLAVATRLQDGGTWRPVSRRRQRRGDLARLCGSHFRRGCIASDGRVPTVEPIATADWPTPARRPADSRLDCTRLHDIYGVRLADWRPSLRRAVAAICTSMAPV